MADPNFSLLFQPDAPAQQVRRRARHAEWAIHLGTPAGWPHADLQRLDLCPRTRSTTSSRRDPWPQPATVCPLAFPYNSQAQGLLVGWTGMHGGCKAQGFTGARGAWGARGGGWVGWGSCIRDEHGNAGPATQGSLLWVALPATQPVRWVGGCMGASWGIIEAWWVGWEGA